MMYQRSVFQLLENHILKKKQISLIVGARQVGKTTLMEQLKKAIDALGNISFFLTLEDRRIRDQLSREPQNLFQLIPSITSDRRVYVFLDEIQYLDDPSNFLKLLYDLHGAKLKFIVSGSSSFYIDSKFRDSLAGRKRIFELPTLSFREHLIFNDRDDLAEMVNTGRKIPLVYRDDINQYFYEYLIYGGYPEVVLAEDQFEKQAILDELAGSYVKKDAVEAGFQYPDAYLTLLIALAGQVGGLLNVSNLASISGLNIKTVNTYLHVMRKSFHISIIKPFSGNVQGELRKMPKVYFNDLGLRNHFISNYLPIGLRPDRGSILENYIYRLFKDRFGDDKIRFWRTQKKREVDFIINANSPNTTAIEVKYSKSLYNHRKYRYFRENNPDIPLTLVTMDSALEWNPEAVEPDINE